VRQSQSGAQGITIGTNALEEASVTTGAIGVEFSDAQSGVISYTTKAGGEKIAGSGSYESDEPFGNAISVGYNRMEGSLGGPVPKVANLTWFGSGVLSGQQSRFRGAGFEKVPYYVMGGVDQIVTDTAANGSLTATALPRFVQYSGQCGETGSSASAMAQAIHDNYGFACQGRRRSMDWTSFIQLQGKLQYSYGSGSSVALTGLASGNQRRTFPGRTIGDPALFGGVHDWSRLGVLNWVHQVSRSAERALSLNLNLSWATDRSVAAPLDPANEVETRDPRMGIRLGTLQFAGLNGTLRRPEMTGFLVGATQHPRKTNLKKSLFGSWGRSQAAVSRRFLVSLPGLDRTTAAMAHGPSPVVLSDAATIWNRVLTWHFDKLRSPRCD